MGTITPSFRFCYALVNNAMCRKVCMATTTMRVAPSCDYPLIVFKILMHATKEIYGVARQDRPPPPVRQQKWKGSHGRKAKQSQP